MAEIKKVGMVILMQPDVEAAVECYKNLGLRLKFHLKERWAEFEINGVKIGLCPTSRPATTLIRTGIVLEVDDLHAIYKEFQGKVEFVGEPSEAVHGIMVSFKDVGGNILDLYQPTPEKVAELVRQTVESDQAGNEGCCSDADGCCQEGGQDKAGCDS